MTITNAPPRGIALSGLLIEDADAPWTDLAVSGTWTHSEAGTFTLTPAMFDRWVERVVRTGRRVKVDYDHNTLLEGAGPDLAKASGSIEPRHPSFRQVRRRWDDGSTRTVLQARIDWTPEARGRIRAGEYWSTSPVFTEDELFNVALCTEPFFPGLMPVAATRASGRRALAATQKPPKETAERWELVTHLLADIGLFEEEQRAYGAQVLLEQGVDAFMQWLDTLDSLAIPENNGFARTSTKANLREFLSVCSGHPDTDALRLVLCLARAESDGDAPTSAGLSQALNQFPGARRLYRRAIRGSEVQARLAALAREGIRGGIEQLVALTDSPLSPSEGDPWDRLRELARARAERDGIPLGKALVLVRNENPDLARAYKARMVAGSYNVR